MQVVTHKCRMVFGGFGRGAKKRLSYFDSKGFVWRVERYNTS